MDDIGNPYGPFGGGDPASSYQYWLALKQQKDQERRALAQVLAGEGPPPLQMQAHNVQLPVASGRPAITPDMSVTMLPMGRGGAPQRGGQNPSQAQINSAARSAYQPGGYASIDASSWY